jgi:ribosomal protein L20A (L18A)
MPALFVGVLIAGLIAGVISMVGGIDRSARGGARVKYLNVPTVAAAATVFGIVGYPLARYSALHTAVIFGISGAAAAGAGVAMLAVIAGWAVPSATREVKDARYELQGHFARVSRAIAERAAGEIEYSEEGATHRVSARSVDERAIEGGAEVVIERIEDGIAYVERWSTIAKQLELPA